LLHGRDARDRAAGPQWSAPAEQGLLHGRDARELRGRI
jgi:hypothetical protein